MDLRKKKQRSRETPRDGRRLSTILAGDFIAIMVLVLAAVPLLHEASKKHLAELFKQNLGGVIIDRKPVPPEQSVIFVAANGRIEVAHVDPRDRWANVGFRMPFRELTELVTYASTTIASNPNRYFVVVPESELSWGELSVVLESLVTSKVKHFRFANPESEKRPQGSAQPWLSIQAPSQNRIASIALESEARK